MKHFALFPQIIEADDPASQAKLPIYTLLHVVGATTCTTTTASASASASALPPEALAMRVKCGCLTCERAPSIMTAPSTAPPSKRDAAQLTSTTNTANTAVIYGAAYEYFAVDPCHAVIPGMPVGGWKPDEVVPHRRSMSYRSKKVLLVYTLCVRVRVHGPDASASKRSKRSTTKDDAEADDHDYTETEWKGAFEYYKTSAWDDFVAKNPKWRDIGHCYFLVLGGQYVRYDQWGKRDTGPPFLWVWFFSDPLIFCYVSVVLLKFKFKFTFKF